MFNNQEYMLSMSVLVPKIIILLPLAGIAWYLQDKFANYENSNYHYSSHPSQSSNIDTSTSYNKNSSSIDYYNIGAYVLGGALAIGAVGGGIGLLCFSQTALATVTTLAIANPILPILLLTGAVLIGSTATLAIQEDYKYSKG